VGSVPQTVLALYSLSLLIRLSEPSDYVRIRSYVRARTHNEEGNLYMYPITVTFSVTIPRRLTDILDKDRLK